MYSGCQANRCGYRPKRIYIPPAHKRETQRRPVCLSEFLYKARQALRRPPKQRPFQNRYSPFAPQPL